MRSFFGCVIIALALCHFSNAQNDTTTVSLTTVGLTTEGLSTGIDLTSGIYDSTTGAFSGNLTGCADYAGCGSCVGDNGCVWCKSSNSCISGTWYGASSSCSDWRWKQCEVMGKWTLVASAGIVGLILLSFVLCICCCCCCKRKGNKKQVKDFKEFKAIQMEEEKETLISKHPKTDSRRDELRKKYALKSESV